MMKFSAVILCFLYSFFLASCSTNRSLTSIKEGAAQSPTEEPALATSDEEQGQNVYVVRNAHDTETKEGQVIGSASIEHAEANKKHVYFLYGAQHLNLKNYYFDIPVVYNKKVQKWIKYFLGKGKRHFVRYSKRAGRYAPVLGKILEDNGLPRDLIFLAMAESGFHNKAKSWAKAVGPWQFMPFTGRRYGLKINWYLDERRDPLKATIAAARYLDDLYELFGSWELAISGYNAGEGKIGRAIRRYQTRNFWKLSKGRYLKRETKNYVPKIMALAIIGKNLESFGFKDIGFERPLDFDEIDVPGNTDLYKVANAIDVDFEMIKKLNPEIMRWVTPPSMEVYKLRVPVGKKLVYEKCCSSFDLLAKDFEEYSVRSSRGVTLKRLARKFRLKYVSVLEDLNGLRAKTILKRGNKILLPFHRDHGRRGSMYADLYERPRKRVRRARSYRRRIRLAQRRGRKITNPTGFYVVKKGDSLWSISRKIGVSLDTLIASNLKIVRSRMIRRGDRLTIR
ncbi:MAG: transglycosylase SLT domain-containing protein [Bacteriovoracales bacterium]|nr:transglycosylase SLT domain-containing protein [Bacteriovoracales bacterium]